MPLTSAITKKLDIPGEPGQWIKVRMVSYITLDQAGDEILNAMARRSEAFAALRDYIPGVGKPAEPSTAELTPEELIQAERTRREAKYDRTVILEHGIVEWSYKAELPESVGDLDQATSLWAFHEILSFTLPPEEEVKKGSSHSTSTSEDSAPSQ